MGLVIAFPVWRVVTRDEGYAPGDPVALVRPSGAYAPITRVIRRRLIASPDPEEPIRQEITVEIGDGSRFLLRYIRQDDRWDVTPL